MSVLTDKHFHNEAAAYAFVEKRIWANGITCPHCRNSDQARVGVLGGKSTRIGVRKCYACRKPFTVKVGTIFESSHLPLHLWLVMFAGVVPAAAVLHHLVERPARHALRGWSDRGYPTPFGAKTAKAA